MPHLHLSTSADLVENVDVPEILDALVAELSSFESIAPSSVKAYHTLHTQWAMGEGAPDGFAHLEVRILGGREEAVRVEVADRMYAQLNALFERSLQSGEASLTLELREMDPAGYRK